MNTEKYIKYLKDIQKYKAELLRMRETANTCNELHDYVSTIISYIKMSDIDKESIDPYASQLETNLCNINPKIKYSSNSSSSQKKFRSTQHEVDTTLHFVISRIESRINRYDSPAK